MDRKDKILAALLKEASKSGDKEFQYFTGEPHEDALREEIKIKTQDIEERFEFVYRCLMPQPIRKGEITPARLKYRGVHSGIYTIDGIPVDADVTVRPSRSGKRKEWRTRVYFDDLQEAYFQNWLLLKNIAGSASALRGYRSDIAQRKKQMEGDKL